MRHKDGLDHPAPNVQETSRIMRNKTQRTNRDLDLPKDTTTDVRGGAVDGISRLIAVTQMKADNAN